MHLPGFGYGNFTCFKASNYSPSLKILGLTRDNCPSILTAGMNVSCYFLCGTDMPNDYC